MRDCYSCLYQHGCKLHQEAQEGFGFTVTKEDWEKACDKVYKEMKERKYKWQD